jgi:hypothetical protein
MGDGFASIIKSGGQVDLVWWLMARLGSAQNSDEGLLLGEDGLLLGEDSDEDGDDEGDDPLLLLDFGQQPSPSTITSHLSLSAECLAMP